jgi:hypothetical protein
MDLSTHLKSLFATFGNAEVNKNMASYMTERKYFLSKQFTILEVLMLLRGSALHRRTMWHSRHPYFPPVALCAPWQKHSPSLLHPQTMAGSPAFCRKKWYVITTNVPCISGSDPNLLS